MKIARHAKILELIENYDIETQDELAQRLCEEGFVVTQATVSRDIREMKLHCFGNALSPWGEGFRMVDGI